MCGRLRVGKEVAKFRFASPQCFLRALALHVLDPQRFVSDFQSLVGVASMIRGGHYGQRSYEPRQKAGHMAAPTNAAKREESSIDLPHQMIFGNRVAKMKLVEQVQHRSRPVGGIADKPLMAGPLSLRKSAMVL
jgi:hypothetical protein